MFLLHLQHNESTNILASFHARLNIFVVLEHVCNYRTISIFVRHLAQYRKIELRFTGPVVQSRICANLGLKFNKPL